MMIINIILILLIVLSVFLGSLFGGAETGIYQLSRIRLQLGIEKKRLPFVMLGKIVRDSPALLVSILIGNNLAHYIATSMVTYMLLSRMQAEHTVELFATVLTAPVLFVFSELVPKNIFYYRSDTLVPLTAPLLFVFHKICTYSGLTPALRFISHGFAKLIGVSDPSKRAVTAVQKHQIGAILKDTHEEGLLSKVQSDIINRLVLISNIRISSVMIPVKEVLMVDKNSDKQLLFDILQKNVFTRLPVYDHWPENIIGFIDIYDCLSSTQQFDNLNNFIKPVRKLAADTTVTDAINVMRKEKQKIVLVTKVSHIGRGKPIGIVTMKDLVEELLGELAEW